MGDGAVGGAAGRGGAPDQGAGALLCLSITIVLFRSVQITDTKLSCARGSKHVWLYFNDRRLTTVTTVVCWLVVTQLHRLSSLSGGRLFCSRCALSVRPGWSSSAPVPAPASCTASTSQPPSCPTCRPPGLTPGGLKSNIITVNSTGLPQLRNLNKITK